MTRSVASLEHRRLLDVVREYEEQGYRVVRQPNQDELPDFLADFAPDLVAYGPEETVVVEVRSKSTLSGSADLTALTDAVNAVPGWRLDLVVTNPRSMPIVAAGTEELDRAEIQARVGAVRQLLRASQKEAAMLLAWSATEAALRLLARRQDIELERDHPSFIVKKLYSLGVLSREEYEVLQEGLRFRNSIVHGYRSPESKRDVVNELLTEVTGWLEADPAL